MTWSSYLPVAEVRAHAVRCWRRREPELQGWSAVPTTVDRYLLDDGRIVQQDHYPGAEKPTRHYLVTTRAREEMAANPGMWVERPLVVVGGSVIYDR